MRGGWTINPRHPKGKAMQIRPFAALRPVPASAARVAAPPYDVVDAAEARALAEGNPLSFLHVSRAEIDLPPQTDPYSPVVYARAAENLRALERNGTLIREAVPALYVYRQCMGTHEQRGVVACLHTADYERNRIRKHEKTRQDKEDDRVRHTLALRANSGPVFLMYRDTPILDRLVTDIERQAPLHDFVAPDGIVHTVWRAGDAEALVRAFDAVPLTYIADGHHRAAAAARAAAELRKRDAADPGIAEAEWFMAVLFPAGQLRILPYNRLVRDLNGMTPAAFLDAVRERFRVGEHASPAPERACRVSMFLEGRWYGLSWELPPGTDPVRALDVSHLQENLLDPVLGIRDPRTDKRIEFVGGIRGTHELERRVSEGRSAVAFSMYPVVPEQVMAVSDASQIMPPKSTWFEPKLRSGLLVHTF